MTVHTETTDHRVRPLIFGSRFVHYLMLIILLGSGSVASVTAQQASQAEQMRELREELAVITDLGLLLGFILRMDQEEPDLALRSSQVSQLRSITDEIAATERLEPQTARKMLDTIEEEVLTPEQLLHTDKLFITREETRVPGSGSSGGSTVSPAQDDGSSAGGSAAAYAAGEPYNPLTDHSRQVGETFRKLRERLQD